MRSRIILLGDIIDPVPPGLEMADELHEAMLTRDLDAMYRKGNNDWWLDHSCHRVRLWDQHHEVGTRSIEFPEVVFIDGGNYPGMPWSHHHDVITTDQEQQWAALLALDGQDTGDSHLEPPSVLASHFPIISGFMMEWWKAALQQTEIRTLVFGHLHEPYLDSILREYGSWKIILASDHRERMLHEIAE